MNRPYGMNKHSVLAKAYYQSGLMAKAIDEVFKMAVVRDQVTPEDEATVSVIAKARIDQLRKARRIICVIEEREENKGKINRVLALRGFKSKVEEELTGLLTQFCNAIDNVFLVHPTSEASKILFMKTKADILRYLAEIGKGQAQQVQNAYAQVYEAARNTFGPAHPIRTGTALNYSVFFYEIKGNKEMAVQIAKTATEEAMSAVKNLPTDEKEDAMEVIQLLQTNLKNWA